MGKLLQAEMVIAFENQGGSKQMKCCLISCESDVGDWSMVILYSFQLERDLGVFARRGCVASPVGDLRRSKPNQNLRPFWLKP